MIISLFGTECKNSQVHHPFAILVLDNATNEEPDSEVLERSLHDSLEEFEPFSGPIVRLGFWRRPLFRPCFCGIRKVGEFLFRQLLHDGVHRVLVLRHVCSFTWPGPGQRCTNGLNVEFL